MKTEITENKMVTFEYHNVERRILLHRDVPLREIHDILKSDFGLPASASLLLFNIVGNYSVCGSTAGILWALNDAKVPKYRIVVGGETSKGKYELMKRKSNIHNHSKQLHSSKKIFVC
ncbi:unnamed protein product [Rotaria socialis]|uniref:Uncharacterized protein n=1 Tax=Rotaria socialis TaxID=392032 RepID=A0A817TXU3_9BILA|nr:unnamed protein product [Rotaria socialis]